MGRRVRKIHPQAPLCCQTLAWSLAASVGKRSRCKLHLLPLNLSPAAFTCSGAALGQGSPEGSGHRRTEPVRDPREVFVPPSTACQIMPALGELGRAGLALRDRSSPGLSQQYPSNTSTPHTRACGTRIPLLPEGSRERQVFPLFHSEAGLESRWAQDNTWQHRALSPKG